MAEPGFEFMHQQIKDLTPALRIKEGQDFWEWQKAAREKLRELLSLDLFTPCDPKLEICWEKEENGVREIRFTFESEAGCRIPCHLLLPKNPNPTPVICLQGHSTGMHISLGRPRYPGDEETIRGDRDFAVQAVNRGFAAIAMEQRYMGECGGSENGPGCVHNQALPALLEGKCAIGQRVWDIMRLIDVLEGSFSQYFSVKRLVCMGNSGGGTATFYAACMEERIAFAMVSCAFCTFADSIAAMPHCACNYIPGIARWFDMGDLSGLIAPRKLLAAAGREDGIFPLDGVRESFAITQSLFRKAGCPENCRLLVGEGGHRFYGKESWALYEEMNRG